jgi:hypothetical protein
MTSKQFDPRIILIPQIFWLESKKRNIQNFRFLAPEMTTVLGFLRRCSKVISSLVVGLSRVRALPIGLAAKRSVHYICDYWSERSACAALGRYCGKKCPLYLVLFFFLLFSATYFSPELTPNGVLAPGSAHSRPSARPHIHMRGHFSVHISAESPSNISPNLLKVISQVSEPCDLSF